MGGPSYETPYPVSDQRGGKVIWNWGTKEWSPYTPPKPGADTPPKAGTPDSDSAGGQSAAPDKAPDTAGDVSTGTGDRAPGAGIPEVKRSPTPKPVRRRSSGGAVSLPGQSLLAVRDY